VADADLLQLYQDTSEKEASRWPSSMS